MKYKVQGLILGFVLLMPLSSFGQDILPSGKVIGRIFADFTQQLNGQDSFRGFNVRKAYLGYNYFYDSKISAKILLDIGKPLPLDDKRYAFVKNALIQYKATDKLTFSAGITSVKGGTIPNSYWVRKYIRDPFLIEHKFMNTADLGFTIDYKVSDKVSLDVGIYNGEGYSKIQIDNILQYATGITLTPIEGLSFRLYGDLYIGEDASRNTVTGFVGYRNYKFMIGAEYSYKTDIDMTDMHNIYGYSAIASINIVPKLDVFGRFDKLGSITLDGDTDPWNIINDGSLIVGGLQYTYAKYIKFSLNYQGWTSEDSNEERWDSIQVNALFKF